MLQVDATKKVLSRKIMLKNGRKCWETWIFNEEDRSYSVKLKQPDGTLGRAGIVILPNRELLAVRSTMPEWWGPIPTRRTLEDLISKHARKDEVESNSVNITFVVYDSQRHILMRKSEKSPYYILPGAFARKSSPLEAQMETMTTHYLGVAIPAKEWKEVSCLYEAEYARFHLILELRRPLEHVVTRGRLYDAWKPRSQEDVMTFKTTARLHFRAVNLFETHPDLLPA